MSPNLYKTCESIFLSHLLNTYHKREGQEGEGGGKGIDKPIFFFFFKLKLNSGSRTVSLGPIYSRGR